MAQLMAQPPVLSTIRLRLGLIWGDQLRAGKSYGPTHGPTHGPTQGFAVIPLALALWMENIEGY